MSFFNFLFGDRDRMRNQNLFTPEQQQALQQYYNNPIQQNPLYQSGGSYLQQLLSGDPNAFSQFEAPIQQKYQQEIIPGLAEQFAGAGTGAGAANSSGLYQTLAQAGRSLSTDLAGLRGQLQMQALPQALGYAQQPYQNALSGLQARQFQPYYQQGSTGLVGGIANGIGQGLAGGAGLGFGLPFGAGLFNKFGGGGGRANPGGIGGAY